jgi:hypothetical protein
MRSFGCLNGIIYAMPRGSFDRTESLNHLNCRDLRLEQMFRRAHLIPKHIKISWKDARTLANLY